MTSKIKFNHRIQKNIIILILSIFFALFGLYSSQDGSLFQASILGVNEQSIINQNKRDIAFKNTDNLLDIFLSPQIQKQKIHNLSINIIYNASYNQVFLDSITFQKELEIKHKDGLIQIYINDLNNFNFQESLLTLPFSGSQEDILISDVVGNYDSNKIGLSIGNLTEQLSHSQN